MPKTIAKTTKHTVQKGEMLSKICKSYGVADWKSVWNDSANAKLARSRKKPEALQPGDIIVINPPGPDKKETAAALKEMDGIVASLQAKIKRLEAVKKDLDGIHQEGRAELDKSYKKAKKVGDATDAAATIALLVIDLGKLVTKGYKTLKLSGKELAKANDELAKEVMKGKAKQTAELGALVVAQSKPKQSAAANAVIAAASAWSSLTSPSFWAYGYVKGLEEWQKSGSIPKAWAAGATADPKADYQAAVKNLQNGHKNNLKKLDEAISALNKSLAEANKKRAAYAKNPQ